jgi:diamine N-acetyltransferase
MPRTAVSLRAVDSGNYRECIALTVAPDQERFVASNVMSLAESYVWRDGAEPYAVYSDDQVVGFALLFPLGEGEPDDSVPHPDTIRGFVLVRLMIDRRFQGHGLGRAALDAIVELIRSRGLQTIRLSVVPENAQALEFYRRNGFVETGETEGDELVMERRLETESP